MNNNNDRDRLADEYFNRDKHPIDKVDPICAFYAGWDARRFEVDQLRVDYKDALAVINNDKSINKLKIFKEFKSILNELKYKEPDIILKKKHKRMLAGENLNLFLQAPHGMEGLYIYNKQLIVKIAELESQLKVCRPINDWIKNAKLKIKKLEIKSAKLLKALNKAKIAMSDSYHRDVGVEECQLDNINKIITEISLLP